MAKFEAFVAYNKAHDASRKPLRITRKLFQMSKHHENMITFLRRNDYFLRRNTGTNFEILSFRAIYLFSDCVFNLTVSK